MSAPLETSHQLVVVARLAEFCQYGRPLRVADPWEYMREKLMQVEEPLHALKSNLLERTRRQLLSELSQGPLTDDRFSDYRLLFERLVSRGQFVDVAIHLAASPPPSVPLLTQALSSLTVHHAFLEERLPASQRSPAWEKLVGEISGRIQVQLLQRTLERKARTARRRAMVLRRLRFNVAEYCSVVHIPTTPQDTFTPFMLPRVEAVVAAALRFLTKNR
jgi:hypothetical protein